MGAPASILDLLEFRGSVVFTPVASTDPAATWGPWECWRNCVGGTLPDGSAGLIPTGDWIAWNRPGDGPMNVLGFPTRLEVELFCVLQNNGEPTRVVDPFTGEIASEHSYEALRGRVDAEMQRMRDVG